jgi:hypothetical protein
MVVLVGESRLEPPVTVAELDSERLQTVEVEVRRCCHFA